VGGGGGGGRGSRLGTATKGDVGRFWFCSKILSEAIRTGALGQTRRTHNRSAGLAECLMAWLIKHLAVSFRSSEVTASVQGRR